MTGSRKTGTMVKGCCWDENELFIGIAKLAFGSGTW
jgi:hypothetical protein